MSRITFIVALALSILVPSSFGQNSPPHHRESGDAIVDGAIHPEMIPDSIAYRLYFVTLSRDWTECDRRGPCSSAITPEENRASTN
jgi:hypothetical protein